MGSRLGAQQHACAGLEIGDEASDEAGLADPGLTRDDDDAAVAPRCRSAPLRELESMPLHVRGAPHHKDRPARAFVQPSFTVGVYLRLLGEVASCPCPLDQHVSPQRQVGDLHSSLRDPDERSVAAIRGQPFRPTGWSQPHSARACGTSLSLSPRDDERLSAAEPGAENPASARMQAPRLPPASRNSTTGLPLSVPRTSTKIATVPLPETTSVPVLVVSRRVPLVTSTRRPNGTGPPVNGLPFNSTLPVGVPLTAPPGGTAPGRKDATVLASGFPPAFAKLPPATSVPPKIASAVTLPFSGPLPAPFDPTACQALPSK